jgi:hypothetical protein
MLKIPNKKQKQAHELLEFSRMFFSSFITHHSSFIILYNAVSAFGRLRRFAQIVFSSPLRLSTSAFLRVCPSSSAAKNFIFTAANVKLYKD